MKKFKDYYVTIGLEIHVALNTVSKLFSSSAADFKINKFDLFDTGTPGVLPVLSDAAVEKAVAFGLAVKSKINKASTFERKHYFYPDLPIGYQITQQNNPIIIGGEVLIKNEDEKDVIIQIEHAHIECDAAKSIHDIYSEYTAIDISRCASPLLEIVSMPCMHSPTEAVEYAKTVHKLVTFMEISDGKMAEGSFRVDASISLSKDINKLGTRVEIKNISSFGFLEEALHYEIERQSELLDENGKIIMETRLFNENTLETMSMRKKETVDEYRYMPDNDIPPVILDSNFIENVKLKYHTNYFEIVQNLTKLLEKNNFNTKNVEQYLSNKDWLFVLNNESVQNEKLISLLLYFIPEVYTKLKTANILEEIEMNDIVKLSQTKYEAKELKEIMFNFLKDGKKDVIEKYFPILLDSNEVENIVLNAIKDFTSQIEQAKLGNEKMINFLMGKAMVNLKGKATATQIKEIIVKLISQ